METPSLAVIKELAGGDSDFEKRLINVVKEELPNEIQAYEKSLQAINYQLTAENVHKLKHKISILGLEDSYKMAECHEENLKQSNLSHVAAFGEVLQRMAAFVKKL